MWRSEGWAALFGHNYRLRRFASSALLVMPSQPDSELGRVVAVSDFGRRRSESLFRAIDPAWSPRIYQSPAPPSLPLPLGPGHLRDELHLLGPVGFPIEAEDVVEPHGRLAVGVGFLPGIPRQVSLCLARDKAPIEGRHLVLLGHRQY